MNEAVGKRAHMSEGLEQGPVERTARGMVWLASELRWIGRVVLSSSERFYWDNGFSKASSLAYTSLLSLVPLTLVVFGIVATFMQGHSDVRKFVLQQFLPGGVESLDALLPYLDDLLLGLRNQNVAVIATLVVTSLLLLNSIEYALNQVWQVYEARSITDRLMIFSSIIVILPALAVSGYYTSSKVQPMVAGVYFLSTAYEDALPFLIDFLAFVGLYLVPRAPVRVLSACFGAIVASFLFGWAKSLFAWYVTQFTSYSTFYGALAAVALFLFWLYIAWTIVLFGAEVSYQAQYLPRRGKLWKRSVMTVGDGAMLLCGQALVYLARAFEAGQKLPNELELAERLGCSSVVFKPSLDALEHAGIIMRGDGKDMPLLLMRTPRTITLADLERAIFNGRHTMLLGDEMAKLFSSFGCRRRSSEVTLADIAAEEKA
jgi:membrane protein